MSISGAQEARQLRLDASPVLAGLSIGACGRAAKWYVAGHSPKAEGIVALNPALRAGLGRAVQRRLFSDGVGGRTRLLGRRLNSYIFLY